MYCSGQSYLLEKVSNCNRIIYLFFINKQEDTHLAKPIKVQKEINKIIHFWYAKFASCYVNDQQYGSYLLDKNF